MCKDSGRAKRASRCRTARSINGVSVSQRQDCMVSAVMPYRIRGHDALLIFAGLSEHVRLECIARQPRQQWNSGHINPCMQHVHFRLFCTTLTLCPDIKDSQKNLPAKLQTLVCAYIPSLCNRESVWPGGKPRSNRLFARLNEYFVDRDVLRLPKCVDDRSCDVLRVENFRTCRFAILLDGFLIGRHA